MKDRQEYRNIWHPFEGLERRGLFISFDGLDGAGLSTQAEKLCEWMEAQNCPYYLTKEPSDGPAGAQIRLALTERLTLDELTLALFFAADRADHLANKVIPLLRDGVNVISDRYLLSSLAYQGVHIESDWFEYVNIFFPFPDITFFLDVPPSICMDRIRTNRWHIEKNEKYEELTKVYEQFQQAIARMRSAGAAVSVIRNSNKNTIHDEVIKKVRQLPLARREKPTLLSFGTE